MRLRDFSVIILILGIASAVFLTMLTDPELEANYGTATAHAEDNFTSIAQAINDSSRQTREKSVELQDSLQSEDDVSLFSIGANTFNVIKAPLSFDFLNAAKEISYQIESQYGLPAEIGAALFAIVVVIVVFTIVGAFLRWRA